MRNLFGMIGRRALDFVQEAGAMMLFLGEGLGLAFVPPFRPRRILQEIELIGVKSTLINPVNGIRCVSIELCVTCFNGFFRCTYNFIRSVKNSCN